MIYDWSTPTDNIDLINSDYNSRSKLTGEQLLKIAKDLVNHHRKYTDIIFSLKEHYLKFAQENNNIVQ